MQILKLGLELFFKRLFVNILIVVQLAVAGILACALMAEIQNVNYTNQLASAIFSPDGYIYYMMSSEEHAYRVQGKELPEDAIKPEEYIKSLHVVEHASTVMNIGGFSSIESIQLKGYSGKGWIRGNLSLQRELYALRDNLIMFFLMVIEVN